MTVKAIYAEGVFRPQNPVDLPEQCEVDIEFQIRGAGEHPALTEVNGEGSGTRSIAEELAEIGAQIPADEWKSLPNDLLEQLDHYLYGTPKA
jgi:predicted DNA-binding antitoxin AbrB/MazE fold protein